MSQILNEYGLPSSCLQKAKAYTQKFDPSSVSYLLIFCR